jgi:hypothetical protein
MARLLLILPIKFNVLASVIIFSFEEDSGEFGDFQGCPSVLTPNSEITIGFTNHSVDGRQGNLSTMAWPYAFMPWERPSLRQFAVCPFVDGIEPPLSIQVVPRLGLSCGRSSVRVGAPVL